MNNFIEVLEKELEITKDLLSKVNTKEEYESLINDLVRIKKELKLIKGGNQIKKTMAESNKPKAEIYSKTLDIDGKDIPVVAGGSGFNAELYAGKRVKIARYEIREEIDFYVDDAGVKTNTRNPNSKEKCFKVYLFSEPLKELKLRAGEDPKNSDSYMFSDKTIEMVRDDGTVKNITVQARFNLQKGESGKPEISKAPKALLWQAMRKLGANTLPEVIGKLVVLNAEPSSNEGDDRKFLRMAI